MKDFAGRENDDKNNPISLDSTLSLSMKKDFINMKYKTTYTIYKRDAFHELHNSFKFHKPI